MICYFDTEFNESESGVFLISVGMTRADGEALYLVLDDWREEDCNPWVRENVLPGLGAERCSREAARELIEEFTDECTHFIGWCCVYDWFLLSRLFGSFFDRPDSWPTVPFDINLYMDDETERACPLLGGLAHNALADAVQIEQICGWLIATGRIKRKIRPWDGLL